MESVIDEISKRDNFHLMLVTGNPRAVMEQRISSHMRRHFLNKSTEGLCGVFGDEAYSREELLEKAVNMAQNIFPGFKGFKDQRDFYTNVFYIGDSYNDFKAGLLAKMKTIWVPSRSIQVVMDKLGQDHVHILTQFMADYIRVTNNIESAEVKKFLMIED